MKLTTKFDIGDEVRIIGTTDFGVITNLHLVATADSTDTLYELRFNPGTVIGIHAAGVPESELEAIPAPLTLEEVARTPEEWEVYLDGKVSKSWTDDIDKLFGEL